MIQKFAFASESKFLDRTNLSMRMVRSEKIQTNHLLTSVNNDNIEKPIEIALENHLFANGLISKQLQDDYYGKYKHI